MDRIRRNTMKICLFMLLAVGSFGMMTLTSQAGFRQVEGGYRYYIENTKQYYKGFHKINNKTYYFDKKGIMLTGWQYIKEKKGYFHFADNGVMDRNKWYSVYFLGKDGKMLTKTWIGSRYVDKNGAWISDYKKSVKPGFIKTTAGTKYKKPNGKYAKKEWQWLKVNGRYSWYYFYSNGIMAVSTWLNDYHVDSKGRLESEKWISGRYVDKSGEMVRDGWVKNKYVGSNGKVLKNQWVDDKYVGSNGVLVRNKWIGVRYVGKDGTLAKSCWIGNRYLDKNGVWDKTKKK